MCDGYHVMVMFVRVIKSHRGADSEKVGVIK